MLIDLISLINNSKDSVEVEEEITIPEEYLVDTEIRHMNTVKVTGEIISMGEEVFRVMLNVKGKMVLPCALSLEDVDYPFKIDIDESVGISDDFEKNYKIVANRLDILPILWENIVLEIPSRVVKDDAKIKTEGDGWCLTDEDSTHNNQLSELKELMEMEEKE